MFSCMGDVYETRAYHKAGQENAERSLRWQSFYVSESDDLWLGNGIYFWENYTDACWWKGRNYVNPVILSALLRCRQERFLDLDNKDQRESFIQEMSEVLAEVAGRGYTIKAKSIDIIAGGSCNYYKRKYGTMLIRYSFPEMSGRPQFCATDSSVASHVTLVAFEQNGKVQEVQNEYF